MQHMTASLVYPSRVEIFELESVQEHALIPTGTPRYFAAQFGTQHLPNQLVLASHWVPQT